MALSFAVASCGGGEAPGPNAGAPVPVAPDAERMPAEPSYSSPASAVPIDNKRTLFISEIATSYHSNDVTWLELANPTGAAISLSGYALRSSSIDLETGTTSYSPTEFLLPDVVVPARGFLVVASKPAVHLRDNAQMIHIRSGTATPFWNANGSVELLRNGLTIDFVRFGTSTAAPAMVSEWSGENVPALPSGENEHGKSIVRLHSGGMQDTNAAADWALVNFATPAGANDIAPGVIDSDRDGIPDSAKLAGGTYGGLDLYAMGARRGRRDIFMEIDYMEGADPGLRPRREALEKIRGVFAAKGIALHFDTGSLHAAGFDPAQFNLGGGNTVAFSPCIDLDTLGSPGRAGCGSLQAYKTANFDTRRRFIFHYALFANSQKPDGSAGPSGIAEMDGNDLIVSLGGYDFGTSTANGINMLVNMQAATLMHEFGHNLGLRHGGNEDANYKPNHYSVMNYMYQFAGLSSTPDSVHAAERYYLANGLKGKTFCGLVENSPCTSAFRLDYSDGTSAPIDESRLSEPANIGRGSAAGAYADWDNNDRLTSAVFGRNINPLDGFGRSVLRDYDEWSNLSISFARGYAGSASGRSLDTPMAKIDWRNRLRTHRHVDEEALPYALHRTIRNLRAGGGK